MIYNDSWQPTCEAGPCTVNDFDKRFPIERSFVVENFFTWKKIRFVKYPNNPPDKITVYIWNVWTFFPLKKLVVKLLNETEINTRFHNFLLWTQTSRMWSFEEQLTSEEIESKYKYKIQ